ncbi:MAG: DUF4426 domain-containing protein [Wenzhouxiangella sp.]|nr:MAG: DUF4426 domain-containing protein [Wenzhouxiangella sp.]
MKTHRLLSALLLLGLLGASLTGQAEQAETFGPFAVHYNTFNTDQLTPDVARAYGIQRSGNQALLNIAVIRHGDEDMGTPVTARVSATATNLAGQRRDLDMREIRDQDAIYYIGTFRISNEELLNFRVSVQPEGHPRAHEFNFRQQFYTR